MAYQEATSVASPQDLIGALMTFAASNGWTVDRNDLSGSNRTATLHIVGTSDYVHVYNTDQTGVRMRVSVGYDALLPPASQPSVSEESFTSMLTAPYPKTFFFASNNQVWVTVSVAASGEYRHFTFGVVDKAGTYDGGTYCDGTVWGTNNFWGMFTSNNHTPFAPTFGPITQGGSVRANVPADARANWFFRFAENIQGTSPSVAVSEVGIDQTPGRTITSVMIARADKNAFSGRSIFHTIPIFITRVGSTTYYSPVGVVQDVRWCSINKFDAEQEITIGTDVYKVFPAIAKREMSSGSGLRPGASGDYAYAIKKVV